MEHVSAQPIRDARLHRAIPGTGLRFENPIVLAAGYLKNGEAAAMDTIGNFGFGGMTIGTATPDPQKGNPGKCLFRIPEHQALINRMGLPNAGIERLVENRLRSGYRGAVGISIAPGRETPERDIISDFITCLDQAYAAADYIELDISCPNIPHPDRIAGDDVLGQLFVDVISERNRLAEPSGKRVPIWVKVGPDLDEVELRSFASLLRAADIDGVVATNTTVSRTGIEDSEYAAERGGLSGAPLLPLSLRAIRTLRRALGDDFPIIGSGGVMSVADAVEMLQSGAWLVQIYTGLAYHGQGFVRELLLGLTDHLDRNGLSHVSEIREMTPKFHEI